MSCIYYILIPLLFQVISSQGIGKVYIGTLPNNTVSSLSFNENSVFASRVIPVFIENKNPVDNTDVPITGNIVVGCELSTSGSGFSSATIQTVTLTQANRGGNVQFSAPVKGQAVDIRCFSDSGLQFNKTESISSPSSFTIVSAPTVSICPTGTKDVVVINSQNTQYTFNVRLSDVVAGSPVTITCTGGAGLTFLTATAAIDSREVQVTVTLTVNTPVTGTCSGQSQTGGQYQTANSLGPAVTFQLVQPVVALYPQSLSVATTSFATILLLTSSVPGSATTFRCRADLLPLASVEDALQNPLCRAATPTPGPTADNATDTVTPEWGILTPEVNLDNSVHHALLKATRNVGVSASVQENVVVSCCNTTGPFTLETAILAHVSLTPNATVDWEKSTDININFTTPRTIQNVAFVEVAPCPCDLTGGVCDINCCCDTDCTSSEQETFSRCIPYLDGGQEAALPEYMCDSKHFHKEDWFPLMCVTNEYNSLLGFFYQNENNLRTTQSLLTKVNGKESFTYKEDEERVEPPAPAAKNGYSQNEKVLSVKTNAAGTAERRGVVSLPQRILSGECSTTAPLQYLNDIDSDCSFQLTNAMCSGDSVFNALSYIQSSTTRDPSCPSAFSIMGNPNTGTQNIAETIVNYYCVTDATSYIKSTTTAAPPSTRSLFNYTYPAGCPLDTCGRETTNELPCTGYVDGTTQETLPPRCGFNDHYTQPPSPNINGATCENAVVDVRYNFYWSGPNILKLNATVFLANIVLSTPTNSVVVTQKYKASFVNSFAGSPAEDNFYNVTTPFSRSGKPGYDIDKPMISAMVIRNETDNAFLYMNSNASRQMALWNTGFDGLCSNAGRREILFGKDTFTSCNIYIGTSDLENCTDLSKLIINRLDNLMPAERIGRYGNNNPYGPAQWIEVLREDLTSTCTNSLEANNQTVLSWRFSGFCTDIISGINLDVMYGESGKANGVPTKEIIGAYVSYSKSTWQLTCGSGSLCTDPSYVEPFPITASVRFIKVPANTPEPKIRWEEEHPDICYQDVCWDNFIYPLVRGYTAEPRKYVLAMSLILILFLFGFLFITRPWW
ncbi:tectonic-2 [Mytilus galloprovincialis]|uniref:Tectonic-2 n=1 Tax=Mytilus galloprovincialis TaxID=29158 RepID=A0A8B6GDS9_MYTGA|nr:tectonic-2 [Mytilus galloprovincialis]